MTTFNGIIIEDLRDQLKEAKSRIKALENAIWIIRHTASSENFSDAKNAMKNIRDLSSYVLGDQK